MKKLYLLMITGSFFLTTVYLISNSSPGPVNPAVSNILPMLGSKRSTLARATSAYDKLPLRFEAETAPASPEMRFRTQGSGNRMSFTSTGAILNLNSASETSRAQLLTSESTLVRTDNGKKSELQLRLVGSNTSPRIEGLNQLSGTSNYFIGNDSTGWRTGITTHAGIKYQDVYPGIDMVFYGNQQDLEYDFIVAPGADPDRIKITFDEAKSLRLDEQGNLVLQTDLCEVYQYKPVIYQQKENAREAIKGEYILGGDLTVSFSIGAYDQHKPLIIDPILRYSGFFGKSQNDAFAGGTVDAAGNIYLVSWCIFDDYPTTPGAFQRGKSNSDDIILMKLNPSGTELIYSTYIGGRGYENGVDVEVDAAGNAYLFGVTTSPDFPTTAGAFDRACGTDGSCVDQVSYYVLKLNASGSSLLYSTYFGTGGQGLYPGGMALDAEGNVYFAGLADTGADIPTTPGAFATASPGLFIAKLNSDGSGLIYSTLLGEVGTGVPNGFAIDSSGNAYIAGYIAATNMRTTPDAFQPRSKCILQICSEGFVVKLNSTGTALVYSTYLSGSSGFDIATSIAVDSSGNAYVAGFTDSTDFPTTPGAFQATLRAGELDYFVTKLNPTGSALIYSTFLGGGDREQDPEIAIDTAGNAYVAGSVSSVDFPIKDPIQANCGSCLTGQSSGLFDISVTSRG